MDSSLVKAYECLAPEWVSYLLADHIVDVRILKFTHFFFGWESLTWCNQHQ